MHSFIHSFTYMFRYDSDLSYDVRAAAARERIILTSIGNYYK